MWRSHAIQLNLPGMQKMLRSIAAAEPTLETVRAEPVTGPSADEVRRHLAEMLSRTEFSASARNRRFLTYVIEETLQGRDYRIKAYTIALAVFDRNQNFDPLIDPIVRIEASRLRRAIEHYYLTAGRNDPVRIDMPKGSYVPKFSYRTSDTPVAISADDEPVLAPPSLDITVTPGVKSTPGPRRSLSVYALTLTIVAAVVAWFSANDFDLRGSFSGTPGYSQNPSILVAPFIAPGGSRQDELIASGITYDIISSLTRFDDLFVYGPATSFLSGQAGNRPIPDTDYLLSGTVHINKASLRLNTILTDRRSGRNIWALEREWPTTAENIADATGSVTREVVNLLAQPDGVIQEELQKRIAGRPAAHLSSYECVVRFRQARREFSQLDAKAIEACLKNAVANDPAYAPAFSALALLNIDRYRFWQHESVKSADLLTEAMQLASQAATLEPNASHPYQALSLIYWLRREIDQSIQMAERGLKNNPENVELLADLGLRYALLGKWSQSEPLLSEAFKRDPASPSSYHVGHFLYSYMRADYEQAIKEARGIEAPAIIYGHLVTAAAYGKLGNAAAAQSAIGHIRQIDPLYVYKVRNDLEKRNMAPQIIDEIIDGLRKAGFFPERA